MNRVKVAQVLADSASTLVKVASERDAYKEAYEKLAQSNEELRRHALAEKVASSMHNKGIHADIPYSDLVSDLEKKAASTPDQFRILQEAVELTGPDMMKSASVGSRTHGGGLSPLEQYILGAVS